jgi:hypothetical protein
VVALSLLASVGAFLKASPTLVYHLARWQAEQTPARRSARRRRMWLGWQVKPWLALIVLWTAAVPVLTENAIRAGVRGEIG